MIGFELRAPCDDDVDRLVELQNEGKTEIGQQPTFVAHELRLAWGQPRFERERHARVAVLDGNIVGSTAVWNRLTWAFLEGYVARDARGKGVGSTMLAWALDIARAEPGVTEAYVSVLDRRPDGVALARHAGFEHERSFYWMVNRSPATAQSAPLPNGIRLVPLEGETLAEAARRAHEASFVDHWNYTPATKEEYLHWITDDPDDDPSLWLIAMRDEEIAGFCICYLEGPPDERLGLIAQLGTSREFRGIGLGRALLVEALQRLVSFGARTVGLGVDAENPTGALQLYRAGGFVVEHENMRFRLKL